MERNLKIHVFYIPKGTTELLQFDCMHFEKCIISRYVVCKGIINRFVKISTIFMSISKIYHSLRQNISEG